MAAGVVLAARDAEHIVLAAGRIAAVRSGRLRHSVSQWSKQELVHRLGPELER